MTAITRFGAGRRGAWAALLAGVSVLGVLEVGVLHLVVGAYAPPLAALAVDLVFGIPTAALLVAMASPLWSSHRLDRERLRLRFGWLAGIDIPLRVIRDTATYHPTARQPAQTGLDFDADSATLLLVRSSASALVHIDLTEEVPARTQGWRRVVARAIIVSVDDADAFRAAVDRARSD
ncbi:hypothetical protein [Nocardia altamirensis]|uniref:hypothetical protein n=1 Tax=Nocardia altamirensis TaxID=472158 RepID=UPI000840673C|nr:hypothetical protein [Nocardia altamirensis]